MIDISDIHTSYPDSWWEHVPAHYEYTDRLPNGHCPPLWEDTGGSCRMLYHRHNEYHEHGGWDVWYALTDAQRIAKVQAYETQSGCGDGCILKGDIRIPRDDYIEIDRRLKSAPQISKSRGVLLSIKDGVVVTPLAWVGDVPGSDLNTYTWNKGMPRVRTDGSIYKIFEMDTTYDVEMIADQKIRLAALNALIIAEPSCKIDGYDYSGIHWVTPEPDTPEIPDSPTIPETPDIPDEPEIPPDDKGLDLSILIIAVMLIGIIFWMWLS